MDRVKLKSQEKKKVGPRITHAAKAWAARRTKHAKDSALTPGPSFNPFVLPSVPPGVLPPEMRGSKAPMAMDENIQANNEWSATNAVSFFGGLAYASAYQEGLAFPGYPFLTELAQRPEYRRISETLAMEMTRKGWEFTSVSDDKDKTARIKELNDEMSRLNVKDHFRKCIELDGFFGRAHLYIDTGFTHDREELKTPLGNGRDKLSQQKIKKGQLKRLKTVEPVWTYPTNYDSIDPLTDSWYDPETWFVQGKEVHKSRLLKFVGREVPDLLKPAYSFGGLSMSQMAMPYVNNWLRTRQSVADIIHAFSVFVLSTDLSQSLLEGGEQVFERAEWFNMVRDNKGLMMIDKDSEEFQNVAASLGSLDALQAQTQEHMCTVAGIPVVKLLGIQPAGLNASSEGELRSFFDWIASQQEKIIRPNLTIIVDMAMLNLWGEVDQEITFNFEPLWSLDEQGMAQVRSMEAETGVKLVEGGIVSQLEERKRLAADPESPYSSIEVDEVPDLRSEEEGGLEPKSGAARLAQGAGEEDGEIDPPTGHQTGSGMPQNKDADDKEPYELGALRPDFLQGKNPLRHSFLKDKNPLEGSELDEQDLDPEFLMRRRATRQDEDVDESSLDVNNGKGTGGMYEGKTSVGAKRHATNHPALKGKQLNPEYLKDKNAANPDRLPDLHDDPNKGSPKNREVAQKAMQISKRNQDAKTHTGRNVRGAPDLQRGGLDNRATTGLRIEEAGMGKAAQRTGLRQRREGLGGIGAREIQAGNQQDEVGQWGEQVDHPAFDEGFKESDHPRDDDGQFTGGSGGGGSPFPQGGEKSSPKPSKAAHGPLKKGSMKRTGKQLGSNPGGRFQDEATGKEYYIKKGKTKDHVANEYLAGELYKLAGARTQKYKQVEGGEDIATLWENFDKNNAKDFSPSEKKRAQEYFAIHAWLANWDAAGLEFDNQAIIKGQPVAVDLGGSLKYRAQGAPKGAAFGDKVGEWDSLRDKKINPQNAELFKDMSDADLKKSAHMVTDVSDQAIRDAVKKWDQPAKLADQLIARKNDIAKRAGSSVDDASSGNIGGKDNTVKFTSGMKDMPKELNGIEFKSWTPPEDWTNVEGQMDIEEPDFDIDPDDEDMRTSSGLIIQEPDGRVWLTKPKGKFGGYRHTFPKGEVDEGLSPQANAIKEAFEETGLKARITGMAGDYAGDTSITRFYHAVRESGSPKDAGWESEAVILAPHSKLPDLLNRSRDRKVAESLAQDDAAWKEEQHPRDEDGKFSPYQHSIGLQGEIGKQVKDMMKDLHFEKGEKSASGKYRYVNKNLDVIVIEPPQGGNFKGKPGSLPWSTHWTLYPKNMEGGPIKGKGNNELIAAMGKLKGHIGSTWENAKQEEQPHEVAKPKEKSIWSEHNGLEGKATVASFMDGFSVTLVKNGSIIGYHQVDTLENAEDIANALAKGFLKPDQEIEKKPDGTYGATNAGEMNIKEKPAVYQTMYDGVTGFLAYKFEDWDSNGIEVYKKGDATIKIEVSTGKWLSMNNKNIPKTGEGWASLHDLLVEGKIQSGVTNVKQGAEQWPKVPEQPKPTPQQPKPNPYAEQEKAHQNDFTKLDKLAEHMPKPNTSQKAAIKSYTGSGYNHMNSTLRAGGGIKPGSNEAHMQEYFESCSFPEDTTVYRKVSGDYAKILESVVVEGTVFQDRGFVSTAIGKGVWHGSLTMEIAVKKGAKGAPVHHISVQGKGEKEIVFKSGSRLKVISHTPGHMKVEMLND